MWGEKMADVIEENMWSWKKRVEIKNDEVLTGDVYQTAFSLRKLDFTEKFQTIETLLLKVPVVCVNKVDK